MILSIVPPKIIGTNNNIVGDVDDCPEQTDIEGHE
jgi:hypothetical protein